MHADPMDLGSAAEPAGLHHFSYLCQKAAQTFQDLDSDLLGLARQPWLRHVRLPDQPETDRLFRCHGREIPV